MCHSQRLGNIICLISRHGIAMPMPKGLYFSAVVSSFVFLSSFFFSMPNLWGQWTDLNHTWTHIHLWLQFEKFGLNFPGSYPHGLGSKIAFRGPTLNVDQTYLCNGTWYQQSIRNLSICRALRLKFCELWSRNSWERLASFCHRPKFLHWKTLPALPHGRYITDSRQSLARVMLWHELTV